MSSFPKSFNGFRKPGPTRGERRRAAARAAQREIAVLEIIRSGSKRLDAVSALSGWVDHVRNKTPSWALCACCETHLGPDDEMPAAIGWLHHHFEEEGQKAIVTGICYECAKQSDEQLLAVIFPAMQKILPSMQLINAANIFRDGGRA